MAEISEAFRQALETIRHQAEHALKLLDGSQEKRSLAWKCQRCGHIKHFTRPVSADVAAPCPKCRSELFELTDG
jgi:Zn finger protein HypA/HybF involved in hydrogenase expression